MTAKLGYDLILFRSGSDQNGDFWFRSELIERCIKTPTIEVGKICQEETGDYQQYLTWNSPLLGAWDE